MKITMNIDFLISLVSDTSKTILSFVNFFSYIIILTIKLNPIFLQKNMTPISSK